MERSTSDTNLFYAAAIWNCGEAALFFAAQGPLQSLFGLPPPCDPLTLQLFLVSVFLFGLGFFWVAQDPLNNRAFVKVGIIGKPLIAFIFLGHVLAGNIPISVLAPLIVDLALAGLFLRFFLRTRTQSV